MTGAELGGWIGGIAGGVIGLAGGIFGTWCSIRHTNGPRERAFMVRFSAGFWVAGAGFLVALFLLPSPWKWCLWAPYCIVLPLAITYANRKQQELRAEDAQVAETDE